MNFLAFVHSDNSQTEEAEAAKENRMIHWCVAASVNKAKKPYIEVDGADENGFEIFFGELFEEGFRWIVDVSSLIKKKR